MSDHALMIRDAVIDEGEAERLHNEVIRLRRELAIANGEIARAKAESGHALSALRKQLSPLYLALQAVFGGLDAAGADDSPAQDSRTAAIWASWKTRLGPQCGKIIEALLLQPDMNTTQLAIAIGTHRNNIPNLIFKLNKAGLLNKNGGRFSLKQL